MRKIVVLLMAIVMVIGFINVVEGENQKKAGTEKKRVIPLQTFVNAVAGRAYGDIVAKFGIPSCERRSSMISDYIVYENFVKDERTGEIFSVSVEFRPGFPAGTVKMREGRMVVSSSDLRRVAANVICPYYTFEVKPANDPVVQKYNIYVIPWQPSGFVPTNTQPIPSCEEMNRENDRINQERDREERRKKEKAPLESAVEKLIGKRINSPLREERYPDVSPDPNWKGELFVTKEGEKYVLVPGPKPQDGNYECYLIEDKHKDKVDYLIFKCLIFSYKRQVCMTIWVYKASEEYPSGNRQVAVPRYSTSLEEYAGSSPIDFIALKLWAQVN